MKGDKTDEYGKDFMKIKFDAGDGLLLNKQLKFPTMATVVRSVFKKMANIIPKFI